jgi:hypothetical protein
MPKRVPTDRPKCTGHTPIKVDGIKQRDEHGKVITRPCERWPINGGTVCRSHGGGIRHVREAADRRYAEQQVRGKLAKLIDTGAMIDDPLTELSKLATEAVLWKDIMAQQVAGLAEYRYEDVRGSEQLRSEIAMFERAMDRCNTILVGIAKLNIDDRLMAIKEYQVERVLGAIDAALTHAGVPAELIAPAKIQAARHLHATA